MCLNVCNIVNNAVFTLHSIHLIFLFMDVSCLLINVHLLIIAVASSNSVCNFKPILSQQYSHF